MPRARSSSQRIRRHIASGRRRPTFRPQVLLLEERLPLGDGVLGLFVGAALLPVDVPAFAAVMPAQSFGERGVSTPRFDTFTGEFTPPARQGEAIAGAFAETPDFESAWQPLTGAFNLPIHRRRGELLTSPQREQGSIAALLPVQPSRDATSSVLAAAVPARHTEGDILATLAALRQPVTTAPSGVTTAQDARVKESFGKLPITFEQNVGQTDASVHYFTRGPGYGLFLTGTEAILVLQKPVEAAPEMASVEGAMLSRPCGDVVTAPDCLGRESMPPNADTAPPAIVRMQVLGGNPTPAIVGRDEQPGKVNYFLGNDSAQWRTNVATFDRVEYDEVYPGIDLVWHGSQGQLEYDFVVAPGADPTLICLDFTSAERVDLDAAGDLLVSVGGQTLRQHKPFVYQEVDGARREVASRFVLEEGHVRFVVGAYSVGRPLVIDPVLSYSTYLGGSNLDTAYDIAVDPATGDALLTGSTESVNFPTANPLQQSLGGLLDAFIVRLRADGSALVYSTYFGGSNHDIGKALAIDPSSGDAIVTGATDSPNFPVANPFQPALGGCTAFGCDAFMARVSVDGSALVYSTYLGGRGSDSGYDIAVDPGTGTVFVTGGTGSTDFPTVNPLQPKHGGSYDAFVARVSADGSALLFSTYLGGRASDSGIGIAVDPATGDALVIGTTHSADFPTANAWQPTFGGAGDAFLARVSADGTALAFSTYLGGSGTDYGLAIAVDPNSGGILVTGYTGSGDFPTENPLQPTRSGLFDAFVTRVSADGSALTFSTYLGGCGGLNLGRGIAVDPATGDAIVTGETSSTTFPTANPLQQSLGGAPDAFVTRIRSDGRALVYSTYLGGSSTEQGHSIAVDPNTGDAILTGWTASANFPTVNSFQPTNRGGGDAFVTLIGSSPVAYYYVYPDSGQVTAGVPFDTYVFALDAQFNVIPDYAGAIAFYATDPQATTPGYYQFQRTDRGVASFPGGLTLRTLGVQALYVFDWPSVQVFGYATFNVVC